MSPTWNCGTPGAPHGFRAFTPNPDRDTVPAKPAAPTPEAADTAPASDFDRLPWPEIIELIGGTVQRIQPGEVHFGFHGRDLIASNNGGEYNLHQVTRALDYSLPFGGEVGMQRPRDLLTLEEGHAIQKRRLFQTVKPINDLDRALARIKELELLLAEGPVKPEQSLPGNAQVTGAVRGEKEGEGAGEPSKGEP